jgi:methionyl-tRNA formyltransferase
MKITILADNPKSWVVPFTKELKSELEEMSHDVRLIHDHSQIEKGDILVLLSCEKKLPKQRCSLNTRNLIVHESKLPKGKGWSPLTWQILEGKTEVPITLIEAEEDIDGGRVYNQELMKFQGTELIKEIRQIQAAHTRKLLFDFIKDYPKSKGIKQEGESTYYKKRTPPDSKLDVNKTIKEQFNLLRVVDNDRYPAFFRHKGCEYTLKIFKRG